MPCPFTGPKMFCAGPNFLSQPKNLTAFLVPPLNLLSQQKCMWLSQYINKFLVWHKKCGLAQNILGLVKGQGINAVKFLGWLKKFAPAQNILGSAKGQGIWLNKNKQIRKFVLVGKKNSWKVGFVVLVRILGFCEKVPKNVFHTLLNNHLTALLYCYVKFVQNNVIANSLMYI